MIVVLSAFLIGAVAALVVKPVTLAGITLAALIAWAAYAISTDMALGAALLTGGGAWVASQAGYFSVILLRATAKGATDVKPAAKVAEARVEPESARPASGPQGS